MARYSSMAADQLSAGLLPLADLGIQRAEAEVAVGLERAHAEFLGQGEGLPVVMFGRLDLRGVLMGGDLPEEPQGPRLVAPLLMGTGEVEGTPSELDRLLHAAGQQIGLAHIAHPQRLTAHGPHRGTPLLRLLQQRQGLGDTAGTRHTHSPGPRRSRGTRAGCYKPGRDQGSVRARGWPWRGPSVRRERKPTPRYAWIRLFG